MAIRENATVNVIDGLYKGRTGKVIRVHDLLSVAIVSFDDNGDLGKTHFSELVEIKPQKQAVEPEIPEGAKKISRADFEVALIGSNQYMASRVSSHPLTAVIGSSIGTIVGANITDKIFKDQDVVVMTEDQFVAELWVNCNPKAVGEMIGNIMNLGNNMDVSIAAIMNLRKIPVILFGAEVGK
jgi:hypothetical protein